MSFDARAIVKHLGRPNARDLLPADLRALFDAMLDGSLDAAQMGALWMGMRIKGEGTAELGALLSAAEAAYAHWHIAAGETLPLVIPSYNGARQLPNLVPLLAYLLAREGVPVLVHGVRSDPARVTTREIFSALDNSPCGDAFEAGLRHRRGLPAFVAIDTLAPPIARLLDWRWRIGVRSSIHTIAKLLNPCAGPAVRLVSVTHPDYLDRMRAFLAADPHGVLLLRGAEGEAVAHPRRALRMEYLRDGILDVAAVTPPAAPMAATTTIAGTVTRGAATIAAATNAGATATGDGRNPGGGTMEAEPSAHATDCSVPATAAWIRAALAGTQSIPPTIAAQVAGCLRAVRALPNFGAGERYDVLANRTRASA